MLKHVTPRGCENMERVVTFFGGMYFHTFSIHLMGHFLTHKRNLLHRTKMEKLIFVRAPFFPGPAKLYIFQTFLNALWSQKRKYGHDQSSLLQEILK